MTEQLTPREDASRQPKRRTLTDRLLRSLRERRFTRREVVYDSEVPGFGVHVLKSQLSFVLVARAPGSSQPTRMALGKYAPLTDAEQRAARQRYGALAAEERARLSLDEYLLRTYGATTLAAAREKARVWRNQLRAGVDPRAVEVSAHAAARAAARDTFGAVAERYIARERPAQRRGHVVERILRREVLPHLKGRPIADVTHRDVREVVDKVVERGARTYAFNVLNAARGVFAFAVGRGIIDASPCAVIKPSELIGARTIRTRVFSDDELALLWRAAGEIGYPFGSVVRVLLLTGVRLAEASDAAWSESRPGLSHRKNQGRPL
jgi:hypothetical protein